MNSTDIIKTASKILGLYFLIQAAANLRDIFFNVFWVWGSSYANDLTDAHYVSGLAYILIFNLAVGLILVFKAGWITRIVRPQPTKELNINLDKTDWMELSIVIISALTIIYSVSEIMHKVVSFMYFNDYEKHEKQYFWTNSNKSQVFYSIFKFVTALFFLLNARNFAWRLKKIGDKEDKRHE